MIGYKPRDGAGPAYNPERDFAYITPTFMRQAIENMSAPPNPEFEAWKIANNIGEAEIVAAATALADAQHDFVDATDPVDSLYTALHRRKYYALPFPVRLLLSAMVGDVMIGAWFKAVREVSHVGEESPAQNEMCRFSAAVREFAAAKGAPVLNADAVAENLLAQNRHMRTVYKALLDDYHRAQKRADLAKTELLRRTKLLEMVPKWLRNIFGATYNELPAHQ